ncbi:AcrR family transcriptional regulator [Thermocatellispora tengchongensis]|uniref:AcrR family transcriptional regulator n=1 Tax=Thermocatellispora tengchongensis TaxID=1073253 RepID=A0A840PMY3_9ACTN|nr:helix-turn-helix domain-containing protein [Thermocatellispora tengchongensis]MBB5140299.1 AcrR family transcriptional regulator [Thermocatellispora tengchongensis]
MNGAAPESRTRRRTRRAILATAASVLARNRTATLAEIADAAEVGRSTLHRYVSDRDELIRATVEDSIEVVGQAILDARAHEGPPLEAMRRVVMAHVEVGDRLMFLFRDPHVMREYGVVEPEHPVEHDPVIELIERGQAEGVFAPHLSPQWVQRVLWALVTAGIEQVESGRMSPHGVASLVIDTLEHGILAR